MSTVRKAILRVRTVEDVRVFVTVEDFQEVSESHERDNTTKKNKRSEDAVDPSGS